MNVNFSKSFKINMAACLLDNNTIHEFPSMCLYIKAYAVYIHNNATSRESLKNKHG